VPDFIVCYEVPLRSQISYSLLLPNNFRICIFTLHSFHLFSPLFSLFLAMVSRATSQSALWQVNMIQSLLSTSITHLSTFLEPATSQLHHRWKLASASAILIPDVPTNISFHHSLLISTISTRHLGQVYLIWLRNHTLKPFRDLVFGAINKVWWLCPLRNDLQQSPPVLLWRASQLQVVECPVGVRFDNR
jgi:hypothetical protein